MSAGQDHAGRLFTFEMPQKVSPAHRPVKCALYISAGGFWIRSMHHQLATNYGVLTKIHAILRKTARVAKRLMPSECARLEPPVLILSCRDVLAVVLPRRQRQSQLVRGTRRQHCYVSRMVDRPDGPALKLLSGLVRLTRTSCTGAEEFRAVYFRYMY